MNSSRERILGRLRAAQPVPAASPAPPPDMEVFADYRRDLAATFAERLTALSGTCRIVVDDAAAAEVLTTEIGTLPAFIQAAPLLDRLQRAEPRFAACCQAAAAADYPRAEVAIGVTVATRLIARTGSVLLRAASAGGRQVSVLPPTHIVVATADQLVPSLDQALPAVNDNQSSYDVIISGPSRTADIEKILVLGAHGPKRLLVVLIAADDDGKTCG